MTVYLLTAYYYNRYELVYTIVKGYTSDYQKILKLQADLQAGFIPTDDIIQICAAIEEIHEL